MKFKSYVLTLLFTIIAVSTSAESLGGYQKYMNLNSEKLLKKAEEYKRRECMDSALVLYSIVSNRTYNTDDKEEIKRCCKAYIGKMMIYFSYFFDYNNAFENLLAAIDLAKEHDINESFIDMRVGIFYHIIGGICNDSEFKHNALQHFSNAYEYAKQKNDRESMDVIICNMIITSFNLNDTKMIDKIWNTYIDNNNTSFDYRFNILFYNFQKYFNQQEYDKAIAEADKMLAFTKDTKRRRLIIISYKAIIEARFKNADYKEALSYINEQETFVNKWNMREVAIGILKDKEEIYRKLGEKELADEYLRSYYIKKDSLLNLEQMTNLFRIQYKGTSKKMEKEIETITIKNNIYNKVFLIFIGFIIVLITMVALLYIKIKQLKKSKIIIYENNEEYFKFEDKERQKLKDEVKKLENNNDTKSNQDVKIAEAIVEEDMPKENEDIDFETNNSDDDDKYKKNSMTDEEKKKLLDKILTVMEDVNEICSENFSGSRLAELTGYKYNYVSLVINENYGCNFYSLLNRFRVKEACRRLSDDKNYGNYTIDAISNSLGFKSRTTLTTSFKKIIGLTPSQYRSIAKEKSLENKGK